MSAIDGMAVLQATALRHITDIEPLSEDDAACIRDVRAVLERHNRTSRFGLALLHKHFELEEDEVLVEQCNVPERLLVTRPKKVAELGSTPLIKTVFAFDKTVERACEPYCPTDAKGRHQGRKDHY